MIVVVVAACRGAAAAAAVGHSCFACYKNKPDSRQPALPSFGVTSSLRERTKDILSVVVALLFGVGCGALTSATMYLAWTLITNRYNEARDYDDEDSDFNSDYEDVSPKKMGYCKIPDDVPAVLIDVPAPAKEVV
ncbi:transmembrane protein [Thalictrum thalictroides]|uniref:Transmembrane protein n=1 Tax=Thalictrum thalictroides TaxID=46969 RepID=A0A7J6W033_THATH|nr:transmembrane protein [Thalictrum thalictroides]